MSYAHQKKWILITCNRDDFIDLAKSQPHSRIIILIRRSSRVAERTALIRLVDRAGKTGIADNINFA